jgi:hypothetical protein
MIKYWFDPQTQDKDKKIKLATQWHEQISQSITVDQWYAFEKLTVNGSKKNFNDLVLTYNVRSANDL